ncbi:histidinol phosphate phosphatase domain-containing protein [Methanolobus vulcani]|uniref:Histidinol phosphate phosphatase domain-containing protein n=1 Tax=Methanolobus vulcani TaxID=38026 RepID=A0A7Z8KNA9_9EURY|nr:histidinol phosphate phosphatase domain-containing protein [Methanolobus vulcani]TQD25315.1 histidinol phosphate phosphatase domain-containing protein [Methanolobus vulcani]
MIDMHTHSIFSDGELIPSELVRRAVVHGYRAIGITDHADFTNVEHIIKNVSKAKYLEDELDIKVKVGVEITHAPPRKIAPLAKLAKDLGAEIVVVHGETINEPVMPGTNAASVELADVDILAHPGFITIEEAETARENDVCLEITARNGHNRTNGHVARIGMEAGATLVVDTDAHSPDNLITREFALKVAMGAGLTEKQAQDVLNNSMRFL